MRDILGEKSPTLWSVDEIVSHGDEAVLELAGDAVGNLMSQRYLLGRCLLAMDCLKTYEKFGMSDSIHYACQRLKMGDREARTIRRVARRLEGLPMLRQCALHGEIEWSMMREVTSVAVPETEELWVILCQQMNCHQIEDLVSATPAGGIPGEVPLPRKRRTSEYRCRFKPHVVEIIERGREKMSRKIGKTVSYREAVERLFGEYLADQPYDEAAEKVRKEAERDLLAGKLLEEPFIQDAREVALRLGLLEEVEAEPGSESLRVEPQGRFRSEADSGSDHLAQDEHRREAGIGGRAEPALNGQDPPSGIDPGLDHRAPSLLDELGSAPFGEGIFDELRQAVGGALPPEILLESPRPAGGAKPGEPLDCCAHGRSDSLAKSAPFPVPATSEEMGDPALSHVGQSSQPANGERLGDDPALSHVGRPNQPADAGPLGEPVLSHVGQPNAPTAPPILNDLLAHLRFNPDARFVTVAQRKALIRRDGYCCRTPGCCNRTWLHIHHIDQYCRGGKTLPELLIALCTRCHKHVHEGKLRITGTVSDGLVFTDAQGRDLTLMHKLERAIWFDYWKGWSGRETDSLYARALGFAEAA